MGRQGTRDAADGHRRGEFVGGDERDHGAVLAGHEELRTEWLGHTRRQDRRHAL